MGRSSTLPINRPHKQDNGYIQPISRSPTSNAISPSKLTRNQSSSQRNNPPPGRPPALDRQNSVHTRYMSMLLAMDTIPRLHNIFASFCTWILLAGFIIFPGTFTSIQSSLNNDPTIVSNHTATELLHTVKHVPLLVIAGVCCGVGAGGMVWLWWRHHENFVWLLNKIFLPGCLNSFAGLISTLINVYSQQGGEWSVTARVTVIVTGAVMIVTGVLFGIYNFWILEKIKRRHGMELEADRTDEGLVEKIERKAHEPALEPGSVV